MVHTGSKACHPTVYIIRFSHRGALVKISSPANLLDKQIIIGYTIIIRIRLHFHHSSVHVHITSTLPNRSSESSGINNEKYRANYLYMNNKIELTRCHSFTTVKLQMQFCRNIFSCLKKMRNLLH